MNGRVFGAAVTLALCVAVAWPAVGGATNECHGLQVCVSVKGPWAAVAPGRPTQYLLSCPQDRGIVAGLDAQATAGSVRVGFEARTGSPVAPGTSTSTAALFHAAVAGAGTGAGAGGAQLFQPLIGCIPLSGGGGGRSTVSARVTPAGPAVVPLARNVVLRPGAGVRVALRCPGQAKLVGVWTAIAFRTAGPPDPAVARGVSVSGTVVNGQGRFRYAAATSLERAAKAEVQLGLECAP